MRWTLWTRWTAHHKVSDFAVVRCSVLRATSLDGDGDWAEVETLENPDIVDGKVQVSVPVDTTKPAAFYRFSVKNDAETSSEE